MHAILEQVENIDSGVVVALSLLERIETYLKRSGMGPSRFGRKAVNDGRFVADLRRGRIPRPRTKARVLAFLARMTRRSGGKSWHRP